MEEAESNSNVHQALLGVPGTTLDLGRLWIHAASKIPDPGTIKTMENFYREIYAVNGIMDLHFPEHYPVSRLLGCVEVVGCVKCEELACWTELPEGIYEAAVRGLRLVQAPLPVKFPLPEPQDPFSLKSGSLGPFSDGSKAAEDMNPGLLAAIAGAQAAAAQLSKNDTGESITFQGEDGDVSPTEKEKIRGISGDG